MTEPHKHHFQYKAGEKVELRGINKTFFVGFYECKCGEWSSSPVDMQVYLDMRASKNDLEVSIVKN